MHAHTHVHALKHARTHTHTHTHAHSGDTDLYLSICLPIYLSVYLLTIYSPLSLSLSLFLSLSLSECLCMCVYCLLWIPYINVLLVVNAYVLLHIVIMTNIFWLIVCEFEFTGITCMRFEHAFLVPVWEQWPINYFQHPSPESLRHLQLGKGAAPWNDDSFMRPTDPDDLLLQFGKKSDSHNSMFYMSLSAVYIDLQTLIWTQNYTHNVHQHEFLLVMWNLSNSWSSAYFECLLGNVFCIVLLILKCLLGNVFSIVEPHALGILRILKTAYSYSW